LEAIVDEMKRQMEAARAGALAVAAPELSALVVTGGDRVTWLNGLVTCELAKRATGDAIYGLHVEKKGRIVSDLYVVLDTERVVVALPANVTEAVRASLDHYLVMEDAELTTGDFAVWFVHGPRASDVLAAVRAVGGVGGLLDRTGLGGAVVLASPETRDGVRAALDSSATIGDAAGWEALRLERGVPSFGVDFDGASYAQEAGLEKTAVSFSKGCYLGQEVVCMLEMRGHVKKKLASIVLDGAPPVRGSDVADVSGVKVGDVTSAITSPLLGRSVALAMVKRASAEAGTSLTIDGRTATVVDRPA
jgi:folate-binding protein YgfZ